MLYLKLFNGSYNIEIDVDYNTLMLSPAIKIDFELLVSEPALGAT